MGQQGENSARIGPYPLNEIYFYLTRGCNLRCRHCWISPHPGGAEGESTVLPLDLFRSILNEAMPLGTTAVKLTGGEPLIHPRIHEILDLVRARNLSLSVETNGTHCTEDLSRKIAACRDPFVSVSLDGTDAETHEWIRGVAGCFQAAVSGIRNLVDAGIAPQIITTLVRRNRNRITDMIAMAGSLGADSVKFNILQPTARGAGLYLDGEALAIEELLDLGEWVEHTLAPASSLPVYYDHPPAFRPLGRIFGRNGGEGCGTCGVLGIMGVLADGSYALCGIGEIVPELVFGRAGRDRLKTVWEGSSALIELRRGLPGRLRGVCGRCLLKRRCLGGCVAQNYYHGGNFWGPFWYCAEADRRGLFPGSRKSL
ncbi:MAG: SynChlorMet cassette radical SAM/SPASM protein ScmF [Syntrophales bacterium]